MTALTASPVSVDFHGTAIPTFSVEGVVRVAMKPICNAIGLDWHGQRQRIKRHPVLSGGAVIITSPSKSGLQKFLTLPLNKLNGWLFGIDTNRTKPEIREKLVEYQAECFDVLSDYWQKGEAINPRASTVGERRPLNRAVRTLANLRSARGEAADYGGMWKLVNGYLGVAHIEDASPAQLDQAMSFVQDAIESESSRIIEGEWLGRSALPQQQATIDAPVAKRWHEYRSADLYGDTAAETSRLSMVLKTLRQAERDGVSVSVADVSGAQEELLAFRHALEMRSINLGAMSRHVEMLERDFLSTVGPAIKPLNPALYGDWRERIGATSRMAKALIR